MHTTSSNEKTQANLLLNGKIDAFFDHFSFGTLLHRCGLRKRHGAGVRSVVQAIFALPFIGKNFYRGIVLNEALLFGKDAAYDLLRSTRANWRRLLLNLCARIHGVMATLTRADRHIETSHPPVA